MRICTWLVVLLAVALAIFLKVWEVKGKLPDFDPVLEEARSAVCNQEDYTKTEFLIENGFMLFKNFVPDYDRQTMIDYVDNVPLPTRYLCGASDTQPRECMMWEEKMFDEFPDTMNKLYSVFKQWNSTGIIKNLQLDRWGDMHAKGSEFITINGWPWPWNMLKGQWEYVMGTTMFGIPRAISQFKSLLTMTLHLPIHSGFHDWHTDGPSPGGGRYHKLFVMVEKDTKNGTMREHTNLMLIPRPLLNKHMGRIRRQSQTMGEWRNSLYRYTGTIHWYHGLDQLACTVVTDPGDAIFFMEDVWHRTQDMRTNRYSLILDIQ